MSPRLKHYLLFGFLVVSVYAAVSITWQRGFRLTAFGDSVQTLCLLAAFAFAFRNVRSAHGRIRAFWTFVSLGFGLWVAYQLLWDYFEVLRHQEVPDPFGGDIVLFVHMVPMMAALAMQPHVHDRGRVTRLDALDFSLLTIWWLYLFMFAVIPWQYVAANQRLDDRLFTILYSTEKAVFLVWLGVLCFRSRNEWRQLYGHWLAASVLYAASSDIANVAIEKNRYYTGSLYDIPLVASLIWLAVLGLLNPRASVSAQAEDEAVAEPNLWTARLAMAAMISLPLLTVWSVFGGRAPTHVRAYRVWLTASTMVIMGLLVYLKQDLLDRRLVHLLRSSQASLATLKRVQSQLVRSEKLASLGHLLAGAAHELNNPLTAVIGYAQLISESNPLTPQQRSLMEKMNKHINRMKSLILDLLGFAKQLPTEKRNLNLHSVIETAVKLCTSRGDGRGMQVELKLIPDCPAVCADSNQLLQVFTYVLRNALDAIEGSGNGKIRIITRQTAGSIIVEFFDNGPGIKEPDRVFDPFYTTKAVGKGTGLGLSACYGIVEEHGGRIACENRPEGGALFRIELPATHQLSVLKV